MRPLPCAWSRCWRTFSPWRKYSLTSGINGSEEFLAHIVTPHEGEVSPNGVEEWLGAEQAIVMRSNRVRADLLREHNHLLWQVTQIIGPLIHDQRAQLVDSSHRSPLKR